MKEMQLNSPLKKGAEGVVMKKNRHNPLSPFTKGESTAATKSKH
jgi:hypothetical protein